MANARQEIDVREQVNFIGLTYFISTLIEPKLESCHVKLTLVTPLRSKTGNLGAYFPTYLN